MWFISASARPKNGLAYRSGQEEDGVVKTYRQYCPIARASEILAERWTLIIIRNLLAGCRTFSEVYDGAPGIPKDTLTNRLELLEQSGIIERKRRPRGRGFLYDLTPRGLSLKVVCDAVGNWGAQWLEMKPEHINAGYVLWATSRLIIADKLPEKRIVIRIDLRDQPRQKFWLLLQRPQPELCTTYPGTPEDLVITTDSKVLINWHLRKFSFEDARRRKLIEVDGSPPLAKAFPTWIRPSPFAHIFANRTEQSTAQ
jgi:DNA-binding HxlR family transcriptional regulator